MYVASAAIGFFFQMKVDTISDSRVHERFQRVCCFMNCWKVSGTIVWLTAFSSYVTFQSRRTQFVSERSSPNVDSTPRNICFSHQSRWGRIASRRQAEKQPLQQVTALKTDSAAFRTLKATK